MSSQDATVRFNLMQDMRRNWAVYPGLALAFLIWCAVDVMPRARLDPNHPELHMTDVTVYTGAAKAMLRGENPYDSTNIRGWPYIYPPLFAILIAPLAPLSEPWQAAGWFLVSALCLLGSYVECRKLLDRVRTVEGANPKDERLFLSLAFAAAAFPMLNCLQRGQVGLFLLYPLLLGVRLVLTERSPVAWVAGGVVLMLPVAVKVTPALPVAGLGFMLMVQAVVRAHLRPRFAWVSTGVVAGGLLFLFLIPSLVVGWDRNLEYLAKFHENVGSKVNDVRTGDFGGDVASRRNQSLTNATFRFGSWVLARLGAGPDDQLVDREPASQMPMDNGSIMGLLLVIRIGALIALLACSVIAAVRRDRLALLAAYGLAMVATFIVSPVARGHYFLLWIPGVLFLSLWLARQQHGGIARKFAFWAVGLCAVHYVLLDFAGRIGVLGIGTTVWFFLACKTLYQTGAKASFFETGDSPTVRAVFVGATLSGERKLKRREGRVPDEVLPLTVQPKPPAAPIPQSPSDDDLPSTLKMTEATPPQDGPSGSWSSGNSHVG
ncbi:MAG: glycosyltransferase family 87 protein [Planctomycetota bacterium]|nr:glycosyltransferase family 87 protein [Planctomycetota bacterium]